MIQVTVVSSSCEAMKIELATLIFLPSECLATCEAIKI